ncbi:MAG: hypothetical protein PVF45_06320 [Anaerolineae bacterium]
MGELRAIGGSGVVVTPTTYTFEEEPVRYQAMMKALEDEGRTLAAARTLALAGSARGAGGTEDEMPLPDDERTRE